MYAAERSWLTNAYIANQPNSYSSCSIEFFSMPNIWYTISYAQYISVLGQNKKCLSLIVVLEEKVSDSKGL